MSSSASQAEGVRTRRIKDLLGWLPTFLGGLGVVLSAVFGILTWYHTHYVDPKAGLAADVCMPVRTVGSATRPALSVKQYEVQNPGFLPLEALELQVIVPNRFAGPDKEPEGLDVDRLPGTKVVYESTKSGAWTVVRATPSVASTTRLAPGERFGVRFIANCEWNPVSGGDSPVVLMDGARCLRVDAALPPLTPPAALKYIAWTLIALMLLLCLGVATLSRWYISYRIRDAQSQLVGNARSEGMTLAERTLAIDVPPPVEQRQAIQSMVEAGREAVSRKNQDSATVATENQVPSQTTVGP